MQAQQLEARILCKITIYSITRLSGHELCSHWILVTITMRSLKSGEAREDQVGRKNMRIVPCIDIAINSQNAVKEPWKGDIGILEYERRDL